jgi:hypothetical protein
MVIHEAIVPASPRVCESHPKVEVAMRETLRVLKEKEIKQFGEYRTRRLVLEAWDRLEQNE